jgi:hypothetical protein
LDRHSLGGEDAGDAGEVIGYTDVRPGCCVEKRLDCGETAVAELQDQDSARLEVRCGLGDEIGVEFVALVAAVEGRGRFVVADFARERGGFAAADVGRIADDKIERKWRVASGK